MKTLQSRDYTFCYSFHCSKDAALLFDNVLPLTPDIFMGDSFALADEIVPSIGKGFVGQYQKLLKMNYEIIGRLSELADEYRKANNVKDREAIWKKFENLVMAIHDTLVSANSIISSAPLLIHPDFIEMFNSLWELKDLDEAKIENRESLYQVDLFELDLVDTEALSHEQIIEIRKDLDSRMKLRRFRAFLNTNYAGKTLTFIEDDLAIKIHEYQETIKKWGIETKLSSLSSIFDYKGVPTALAGITMAIFGEAMITSAGISTAVASTSYTIGKTMLEIKKLNSNYKQVLASNPIAYIMDLRPNNLS